MKEGAKEELFTLFRAEHVGEHIAMTMLVYGGHLHTVSGQSHKQHQLTSLEVTLALWYLDRLPADGKR